MPSWIIVLAVQILMMAMFFGVFRFYSRRVYNADLDLKSKINKLRKAGYVAFPSGVAVGVIISNFTLYLATSTSTTSDNIFKLMGLEFIAFFNAFVVGISAYFGLFRYLRDLKGGEITVKEKFMKVSIFCFSVLVAAFSFTTPLTHLLFFGEY